MNERDPFSPSERDSRLYMGREGMYFNLTLQKQSFYLFIRRKKSRSCTGSV